jgi:hypothetical protein
VGNAAADAAAKAALNLPVSNLKVPYTDYISVIRRVCSSRWQLFWNGEQNNKLHRIQPHLGVVTTRCLPRRDEILIHRLRLGHTYLTHSYLLKGKDPPECIPCHCRLTVEHLLIECVDYAVIRRKYYSVTTICDLFNVVNPRAIVDFIKEIGLYRKL